MRADYTVNIQTDRSYDPQPARVLPKLPIYGRLLELASEYDKLKASGYGYGAFLVKEQAKRELDEWFSNQDGRPADDAEALQKLAEARQHVSTTLAQWKQEQQEGAPF